MKGSRIFIKSKRFSINLNYKDKSVIVKTEIIQKRTKARTFLSTFAY